MTRRQDQPLPRHTAWAVVFRLERELRRGYFQKKELPLKDSTERAKALSESYGFLRRHTALDVWHVAAAWCFGANRLSRSTNARPNLPRMPGWFSLKTARPYSCRCWKSLRSRWKSRSQVWHWWWRVVAMGTCARFVITFNYVHKCYVTLGTTKGLRY